MPHLNELSTLLNQHFNWNKARMNCFCAMLLAVLKLRSMNLKEIAMGMSDNTQLDSRYRRVQRFLDQHWINFDLVAMFIMLLFGFTGTTYYLSMDRSNWQWGEKNINILTLAVVYQGAAIPIFWILLNKKGNSDTRERIALVKRFIKLFGKANILGILADREFIGEDWFAWLKEQEIPFHIRIKKNAIAYSANGKAMPVHKLFQFLKAGEKRVILEVKRVTGVEVYLAGLRLENGELLIIASAQFCAQAIENYAKRWQIETLFGNLKSRGFNLEDTRVTDRIRMKRLLTVVVIAFCWAHRTGEWQVKNVKPLKIKKHQRPVKSIFRCGLDAILDVLLNAVEPLVLLSKQFLQFLDFNGVCNPC
jgi:Transposase DDE domain